jgi:hypothetical protein
MSGHKVRYWPSGGPKPATPLLGKDGTVFDITDAAGLEIDHICCCRSDIALCGADVSGTGVAFGDPALSRRLCQRCANLDADGKRCGEPMCPGPEA